VIAIEPTPYFDARQTFGAKDKRAVFVGRGDSNRCGEVVRHHVVHTVFLSPIARHEIVNDATASDDGPITGLLNSLGMSPQSARQGVVIGWGEFAVDADFECFPCPAQVWCAIGERLTAGGQDWFGKLPVVGRNPVVAVAPRRRVGHRDVTN
jgi:hypothetical protein